MDAPNKPPRPYVRVTDGDGNELPLVHDGSNDPPSDFRPGPPAPLCSHRGGLVARPENAKENTQWVACLNPKLPLKTIESPSGESVCGCRGCGPSCTGYEVEKILTTETQSTQRRAEPDTVLQLDPAKLIATEDKRAFNCSLIDHGGKRLLAYRAGMSASQIYVAEIHGSEIGDKKLLNLAHPKCHAGREDPRWFTFQGQLKLQFSGLSWLPGKPMRVSLLIADLDTNLQVQRIWEPSYAQSRTVEKNWGPFEADGELYSVYTIHPHVVLRIDAGTKAAAVSHSIDWRPAWSGGFLRGGASPVRVGDEFYSFFHGHKLTTHGSSHWYLYSAGCYVFSARPPFAPLRMTPSPIWLPDDDKSCLKFTQDGTVIFPGSASLDNGIWTVAAGHQDMECLIGTFGAGELERAMVRV